MRLGSLLLALLLLLGPITGCLGGDGDAEPASIDENATPDADEELPDATGNSDDEASQGPGAQPSWTHGDWWTYDITFDPGFAELLSGETTLVLHDTQDDNEVAAADRNAAIVDQHFDTFFVGPLDEELNPTDGGFQMFDFPLQDQKTWSAEVATPNGTAELELTAEAATVDLPAGSADGFRIHGEDEDTNISVTYTYAPSVQWVTSFQMQAPDFQGEQREVLSMELLDQGPAYEGTFVVLDMETLYFDDVFGVPVSPDEVTSREGTVEVSEDFTFVQRIVVLFGFDVLGPTSGISRVDLQSPDGEQETYEVVGEGEIIEITIDEPPIAGEWRVTYQNVGTNVAVVGFVGFHEEVVEFTARDHAHHA